MDGHATARTLNAPQTLYDRSVFHYIYVMQLVTYLNTVGRTWTSELASYCKDICNRRCSSTIVEVMNNHQQHSTQVKGKRKWRDTAVCMAACVEKHIPQTEFRFQPLPPMSAVMDRFKGQAVPEAVYSKTQKAVPLTTHYPGLISFFAKSSWFSPTVDHVRAFCERPPLSQRSVRRARQSAPCKAEWLLLGCGLPALIQFCDEEGRIRSVALTFDALPKLVRACMAAELFHDATKAGQQCLVVLRALTQHAQSSAGCSARLQ